MNKRTAKRRTAPPESRADMLVPAVQRVPIRDAGGAVLRPAIAEQAQWDDPEDTNQRSKSPRQVMGYRRADPLVTLHRRGEMITTEHLRAADRYRDDYELGVQGAKPGYERLEVRSGSFAGEPSMDQLDALESYRAATKAVGQKQGRILVEVILGLDDVTRWAERYAISRHHAMGYLVAVLDCLVDHYDGLMLSPGKKVLTR